MKYKIGDTITGKVAGIQPYGAFVKLSDNSQGLIHISECKHGFVSSVSDILSVGQEVTVKVLDIDEYTQKISLSLRLLTKYEPDKKNKIRKHFWSDKTQKIGYQTIANVKKRWVKEALSGIKGLNY